MRELNLDHPSISVNCNDIPNVIEKSRCPCGSELLVCGITGRKLPYCLNSECSKKFNILSKRRLGKLAYELLSDRDKLYELHVIKKVSIHKISYDFKVHHSAIKAYMAIHGIPINRYNVNIDTLSILNDPIRLQSLNSIEKKSLTRMSKELKVHRKTIRRYMVNHGIDIDYSSTMTIIESDFTDFLIDKKIPFSYRDRSVLKSHEVDFYLPDYNLAIEVCGSYWHSSAHDRITETYHYGKFIECRDKGIKLLTIYDTDLSSRGDQIMQYIQSMTKTMDKTKHAIYINEDAVDNIKFDKFMDIFGIGGYAKNISDMRIAVFSGSTMIAGVVCREMKCGGLEIIKYSSKYSTNFLNNILKYISSKYNYNKIRMSSNNMFSQYDILLDCGFKLVRRVKPIFSYLINSNLKIKNNDNSISKYMKKYNNKLSIDQNCLKNKIYKVWDCGIEIYELQ